MSTVCYKPPPGDVERERLREVAKYYCIVDHASASGHSEQGGAQDDVRPEERVRLSSDTALTGLTQLGVLRFGCNRAFVGIIDEAKQHIIAEATASISLASSSRHQQNDGLHLGMRSFDLAWGIAPQIIQFFADRNSSNTLETDNVVAKSTCYVVRDLTREDAYRRRSYVVDWPYMRFYAAVPIRSPRGLVLGSYCVVDDKPRSDFGDTEVERLQEIANAIAQHLETVRLSHCHRRTESLVKSLTTFVKDRSDFDPTDGCKTGRRSSNSVLLSPSESTTELASLFSKVTTSEQSELSVPSRPSDLKCPERPTSALSFHPGDRNGSVPCNAPTVTDSPTGSDAQFQAAETADRVTKIFARASILLRDSMDLDGVLFVDASRCNAGVVSAKDTGTWEPLPSTLNPGFLTDPYPSPMSVPGVGSLSNASEDPCTVLGGALRETAGRNTSHRDFNISEKLLDDLTALFPQGQTFDLDDAAHDQWSVRQSDSGSEIARQLALHFPDARSVLFTPIWDWNKSRWLAGTLVWTSDTFRALGAGELHYFKAFGDSIISEVARADWDATQNSKSAFMSSVSHELRSPLHGILASAELLGTTSLLPAQQHLLNMVESCGLTLLDTLNHLLDFSGINDFTSREESPQSPSEAGTTGLETAFDLGDLVEEVAEVQYAGRKLSKIAVRLNEPDSPTEYDGDTDDDALSVIVRVEDSPTWKIQSVPGAWRRIVMNVLGNSLKWTKAGFVEVSLSKVRRKRDPTHVYALLSVTDTGCGIGSDFLRNKLFSPFSQENALSEGLGLGLSIVRQLVGSLDGHLNVRSEVGVGTQVDIFIPVQTLPGPSAVPPSLSLIDEHASTTPSARICLIGFSDYPALKETPTGILSPEAKRKLAVRSCLTSILSKQGGWNISSSESFADSEGDVAVIEETKFNDNMKHGQINLDDARRRGFKKIFIILNSKKPSAIPLRSSHIIRVSQPFGCRKFREAVGKVQELLQGSPQDDPPCFLSEVVTASGIISTEVEIPTVPEQPWIVAQRSLSEPAASATAQGAGPAPLHLLIVDDNSINQRLLATFAGRIGCTYDTASDGLIALNKYKESERRYDLILMDISMPVMDGVVATNGIRQFEEEKGLPRSRIMAVTGVASTDMQQRAKAAGIDDYLIKPVSLLSLKKVVSAL
ncbi:hypothetical protein BJX61DRAFT_549103 [Aspergillus egyptiacus]|nr:hypothetical protein BJX61DRAFT_549103 [Aspergillus egyptiacus]